MKVLVIDVGGTSVKLFRSGNEEVRRFESGKTLTPDQMVEGVKTHTADWDYEVISLGYPGKVSEDGPCAEPGNLGNGWVGYNFLTAFDKPVRVVNDAVLQAIGGYEGGRMLFLGLGTGVGSALVINRMVVPMDLGCLPYKDRILSEWLGRQAFEKHGKEIWLDALLESVAHLRCSFTADYVLLGGGNAEHVDPLPKGVLLGGNQDAFVGGVKLWQDGVEPNPRADSRVWRILG